MILPREFYRNILGNITVAELEKRGWTIHPLFVFVPVFPGKVLRAEWKVLVIQLHSSYYHDAIIHADEKGLSLKLRIHMILLVVLFLARSLAHAGDLIESAGDVTTLLLPATAAVSTLFLNDLEGGKQLVESVVLSTGASFVLKYAVKERRPDGEDNHSFPSAHSAISFSAAEFIRKRYGLGYGLPAYAAASFVGFSRIEAKRHYFHDVLAGAAIGIGSSYLFTTPFDALKVSGEAGPGYVGLRVAGFW